MRMTLVGGAGLRARLIATSAILASVSISACSGSSPSATPTTFSPGRSASATPTVRPSGTASDSTASASARPSSASPSSASAAASPAAKPSPAASPFPAAAPSTGGGGTAGFQDAVLFGLGVAAILAGAGSIAYRRKAVRNR